MSEDRVTVVEDAFGDLPTGAEHVEAGPAEAILEDGAGLGRKGVPRARLLVRHRELQHLGGHDQAVVVLCLLPRLIPGLAGPQRRVPERVEASPPYLQLVGQTLDPNGNWSPSGPYERAESYVRLLAGCDSLDRDARMVPMGRA